MKATILASLASLLLVAACGSKSTPAPAEPTPGATTGCVASGCSNTICQAADAEPTMTTCEWRPEYACYKDATCERQPDGSCGWTQSDALTACLASPPSE